jgi:hypothetical protein
MRPVLKLLNKTEILRINLGRKMLYSKSRQTAPSNKRSFFDQKRIFKQNTSIPRFFLKSIYLFSKTYNSHNADPSAFIIY